MAIIEIRHENELLAIIIPMSFRKPGINFFTPNTLSQQLAYMEYEPGKVIEAHVHNLVMREVTYTQETLFIRSGKLRVDFYTTQREYLQSTVLGAGDVILLIQGGHGFEVIERLEMVEVKQGPYLGDQDKTRFEPKLQTDLKFMP